MSIFDQQLCRAIAAVTVKKKLSTARKMSIRKLLQEGDKGNQRASGMRDSSSL